MRPEPRRWAKNEEAGERTEDGWAVGAEGEGGNKDAP